VDQAFGGQPPSEGGLVQIRTSGREGVGPLLSDPSVRSLCCVPLGGTDLLGVVYLGTRAERVLAEPEQRLLVTVAAQASAVVVRHREREALGDAVRSRDDVLSVVAHDLQNPLNVITLGATSLLPRLTDSSVRRSVERILKAAQRADRLIRDLLEIGKIESGRFSIEPRRVEPAHVILSAVESQQSLAADASVILATDLSPDLPPLEADEERILEVLENLLGNALKFTGRGGTITVGASRRGEEIEVWVKDTGAGIAPEELPHIFNRFWQARKKARRGSGLGLTICKAIVEAHGGRIWAESTPGVGTTMLFTLPAAAAARSGPREVANILIVDDRPENLLSLTAILQRPDYNLVTARSGEEALSLALRQRFVVALMDVAMPGMSGLEVAVHLKQLERSRDIPIIFITAFGDDPGEIHRAYSAGGADYLVKPLDPEIVRKKVAVFVNLSGRREGTESSDV
jgi:signal transduction histidine kinase/ActR/RegA family two-component response regulator